MQVFLEQGLDRFLLSDLFNSTYIFLWDRRRAADQNSPARCRRQNDVVARLYATVIIAIIIIIAIPRQVDVRKVTHGGNVRKDMP